MNTARPTYNMVRELVRVLEECMTYRANGTLHARGCFNVHVNSQWYECSSTCVETVGALLAAREWLTRSTPPVPKLKVPTDVGNPLQAWEHP